MDTARLGYVCISLILVFKSVIALSYIFQMYIFFIISSLIAHFVQPSELMGLILLASTLFAVIAFL